ncbi:MFS transporter [Flavobacterium psychrophilum]|jgi:DHA1 family tetracycline resistance protein-like MFS transporter|uniref:MFS transporter n=1 Tax=Flavobacterium psychrophilum TaxID=96345 RepID=A0A7U2NGP7_FLAPS|nr:MFS transporter [Flavobacterium psychrophilum]MCB6089503.1 MFS transporter [Flavobacterium psychrophilum]MEB3380394.1 MFS transporter [Flavobacterium psychrophilum]QRE04889.1 MFS transporter [Flavobacterium psychrophilum]SNB29685.1 Major facilitator superfamily (MFS) permease. Putative tetracycline resistance protein [Flavobacterium psychrophilum]
MQNKQNKKHLWFIVGITILNAIGMTIVLPLFPFLLEKYVPNNQIATTMSALVSIFAICQFFASPIFGALSDRFGRKPILLISLLGSAVGYLLLGIGGALWILFLGRIIDGLTAGNQSALFAYIADSTEPNERGKWYGYLGGAIGIGFMIGPAIGGLLGTNSITLPFYVTAVITFVSMICIFLFVPESLKVENRSKQISLKSLNTFLHFKEIFSIKHTKNLIIMGAFFYVGLGIWQFNASIFLKDVFRWGPSFIGSVFMLVGVCDILSRVIILPQMLKRWSEQTVGIIGLLGLVLGLGLLFVSAFISSVFFIIAAVACIVLGEGLFDPSYNARLSTSVDESKQGLLQGTNQSLQALYHVIVPLGAGFIYSYSHGAVFGIATLSMLIGLLLFVKLKG